MTFATENKRLLELAAKYVWWTSPDITVSADIDKLVANVMELGTWDDSIALLDVVGPDPFLAVLDAPRPASSPTNRSPSGIIAWDVMALRQNRGAGSAE